MNSLEQAIIYFLQSNFSSYKDIRNIPREALINFFSNPQTFVDLPFPSNFPLDYIERFVPSMSKYEHPHFVYRGRSKFREIHDFILNPPGPYLKDVIGNIGGGKSHLLAAFVVLLHCLRVCQISTTKVIYLADCKITFEYNLHTGIKDSLFLGFPESQIGEINNIESENDFYSFIQNHQKEDIVFIYDGWNFFQSAGSSPLDESDILSYRKFLKNLATRYRKSIIFGISANEAFSGIISSAPKYKSYELYGGLSIEEWDNWKAHYPIYNNINLDQENELKYLTGLLPLTLFALQTIANQFHLTNLQDIYTNYLNSSNPSILGGLFVAMTTQQFIIKLSKDGNKKEHIRLMKDIISKNVTKLVSIYLLDCRFIMRDENNSFLPINGFYIRIWMNVMTAMMDYQNEFDLHWANVVINNPYINQVVKGFAVEAYTVAKIINDYQNQYRNKVFIVQFDGDYPANISYEDDIVIFWPMKYNLRYVDLIVRIYLMVEKSSAKSKNSINKKMMNHRISKVVAYQIILQKIADHTHSLNFYTTEHQGKVDALRYVVEGEEIDHHFVWIVADPTERIRRIVPIVSQHIFYYKDSLKFII